MACGDERTFERFIGGAGAGAEDAEAPCFFCSGEVADCVGRAVDVGKQIETLVCAPGMAREDFGGAQGHVIAESLAQIVKKLLEHEAHGEHGRTRIDRAPADLDLAHLAAGGGFFLDYGDVHTAGGELEGRRQSANSRADHGHAVRLCHAHLAKSRCVPILTVYTTCQFILTV